MQVYRTAVNYRGECAQRLIRYRQFRWFHKHLEARDRAALRDAVFPEKKWTRGVSLQHEVVEARQVLVRTASSFTPPTVSNCNCDACSSMSTWRRWRRAS